MLAIVDQDNGYAEFQERSLAKVWFLLLCCFLFKIAFLRSCRFQLQKRILLSDKQLFVLFCHPAAKILLNQPPEGLLY